MTTATAHDAAVRLTGALAPPLLSLDKVVPLIKFADPTDERYVLGIVLEPETVDSQGDTISVAEIRKAAYIFMEQFGTRGLMHKEDAGERTKLVETYVAPCDLIIAGVRIRKGTWLMGWRIVCDELWAGVKSGQYTGFSIGGSARREALAA